MEYKAFERGEVLETVRRYDPYELDGPLEDLVTALRKAGEEATDKGWYGLHVWVDQHYDEVTIYVRAWRQETDEEFNARWQAHTARLDAKRLRQKKKVEREAKKLAETEAEQRKLYEELKRKFG